MAIKTNTIGSGINTPSGTFVPVKTSGKKTELLPALIAAAEYANLTEFDVKIDGILHTTAESLPVKYLEDLIQTVSVVQVSAKDSAAIED